MRISSSSGPIPQTLSEELAKRFTLGWSHYVALLSIDDAEARNFYEIEAAENGWSVRELRRQVDSSLYQRSGLRSAATSKRSEGWPARVR